MNIVCILFGHTGTWHYMDKNCTQTLTCTRCHELLSRSKHVFSMDLSKSCFCTRCGNTVHEWEDIPCPFCDHGKVWRSGYTDSNKGYETDCTQCDGNGAFTKCRRCGTYEEDPVSA